MPKNDKKKKNHTADKEERKLLEKTEDTEYGIVTKKLGCSRFLVRPNLKVNEIIGKICGKYRKGNIKKSNWVDIGSVVLIGLRDYQDNTVDIIYVYNPQEIRQLKKMGVILFDTAEQETDGKIDELVDESFDFSEI